MWLSWLSVTVILLHSPPYDTHSGRSHILLSDVTGTVGLTVWNANVAKFSSDGIGSIVHTQNWN